MSKIWNNDNTGTYNRFFFNHRFIQGKINKWIIKMFIYIHGLHWYYIMSDWQSPINYILNTLSRGTRKSSSDFVLVAARAELLISDRESNVSFFDSYTICMKSDYDWSRCISWNTKMNYFIFKPIFTEFSSIIYCSCTYISIMLIWLIIVQSLSFLQ